MFYAIHMIVVIIISFPYVSASVSHITHVRIVNSTIVIIHKQITFRNNYTYFCINTSAYVNLCGYLWRMSSVVFFTYLPVVNNWNDVGWCMMQIIVVYFPWYPGLQLVQLRNSIPFGVVLEHSSLDSPMERSTKHHWKLENEICHPYLQGSVYRENTSFFDHTNLQQYVLWNSPQCFERI